MSKPPLDVYIGYDPSASTAAPLVCAASLMNHASIPLRIEYLDLAWLRRIGLYTRTFYEQAGQRYDTIDGRPFSTEFSFSRFLVPMLQSDGWALFMDQDFLWRGDIAGILEELDPSKAAYCVQHDYRPADSVKMDGQLQQQYPRKNWSSLVLWNCSHPANQRLSVHDVNTRPGEWLHGMRWLADDEIGALPERWNWLDGHSPEMDAVGVHMTRGTPDMHGWDATAYAGEWLDLWGSMTHGDYGLQHAKSGSLDLA